MIHVLTHNPQLQFLHSSHSHNTFFTRPPSTMPLYNHAVRTTPVTSLHTTLHFETFICDSTLCLFLVSLSPETPTSRKVNTMVSNKHLFAHPAELTGPKLLKVAETRSNLQISNCVTEAATTAKPAVTNPTLVTGAAVASRILRALKIRASARSAPRRLERLFAKSKPTLRPSERHMASKSSSLGTPGSVPRPRRSPPGPRQAFR
jgi:hypothetical protein